MTFRKIKYFYFLSFLYAEMAQVVEILPCGIQEPAYPTVISMAADDLVT